jgi:EAL domain-containing protein (putative c-di-GMP-specific phosphodiesterase class I)
VTRTVDVEDGFARAAGDLFVATDACGAILSASGDATFLHHPSADRLVGRHILSLLHEGGEARLREDLWSLGPGRRIQWTDDTRLCGPMTVTAQRTVGETASFRFVFAWTHRRRILSGGAGETPIDDRFRDAVMNGGLAAAWQPVVETRSGVVLYHEVLARFDGPDATADLIRAAETSGQIVHLDYIMIDAAAARLASDGGGRLRLAVNVSGVSLEREDVVSALCASIAGRGVRNGRLIVEITESFPIADTEMARRNLVRLRHAGAHVALDDFGAGSAGFASLSALDVDSLKLDGALIRNQGGSERTLRLLQGLQDMCVRLGVTTVGEHVETAEDRRLLLNAGVPLAQGYLFGKPERIEGFFAARHPSAHVA